MPKCNKVSNITTAFYSTHARTNYNKNYKLYLNVGVDHSLHILGL